MTNKNAEDTAKIPAISDNLHTILLDEIAIEALLDTLSFARDAANFLSEHDITKGNKSSARMIRIGSDAKQLYDFIMKSVKMGEPSSESVN